MRTLTAKQHREKTQLFDEIDAIMTSSGYVQLACYVQRLSDGWYGEALGIHISRPAQPGPDDEWFACQPCHYLLRWFTNGHGWTSRDGIALPRMTLDKINQVVAA